MRLREEPTNRGPLAVLAAWALGLAGAVAAKAAGLVGWSWWWVSAPAWVPVGCVLAAGLLVVAAALVLDVMFPAREGR